MQKLVITQMTLKCIRMPQELDNVAREKNVWATLFNLLTWQTSGKWIAGQIKVFVPTSDPI